MKVEDVKKVFRGIRSTKKEMELRLAFLKDVQSMDFNTATIEASMMRQYEALQERLNLADRMMETLDPQERAILTARYYAGIRWEYMEMETMYSTSQCQRIHDRALKKLTTFEDDGAVLLRPTKSAKRQVRLQSQ